MFYIHSQRVFRLPVSCLIHQNHRPFLQKAGLSVPCCHSMKIIISFQISLYRRIDGFCPFIVIRYHFWIRLKKASHDSPLCASGYCRSNAQFDMIKLYCSRHTYLHIWMEVPTGKYRSTKAFLSAGEMSGTHQRLSLADSDTRQRDFCSP